MSKKILITGGAGFLGSHLCDRLIKRGDDVVCLDNFLTGSRENVAHLLTHPNFKTVHHDICFPFYATVDEIYNLACPASPVHYQCDPIRTTKTSVQGALNMLGLAKQCGARILQASTSEVYGDPKIHPQIETYVGHVNPIGIRACYDVGKRCAEALFFDYHRQHGVDIVVARIFNTYGPNMHPDDGRVISNFIVQALKGETISIYGEGTQTRSFCYVDDLIDGLIKLMEAKDVIGPVNLGNPNECTMIELAEKIVKKVGSASKLKHHPLPSDDPQKRNPDISLAESKLNWSPSVSLDKGLQETIAYFKHLFDKKLRKR